jgi:undecaprenyl-diphosphatase
MEDTLDELIKALILGIIQGITEFLPISSTAHLVITPWIFWMEWCSELFEF